MEIILEKKVAAFPFQGTDMGKMKRGAKLRSFDLDEKEKFLRTCPCKVKY